jgi:hypothetical protein
MINIPKEAPAFGKVRAGITTNAYGFHRRKQRSAFAGQAINRTNFFLTFIPNL